MKNLFKNVVLSLFNISLFNKANFIWMIHPLSVDDIYIRYSFLRILPDNVINFFLKLIPPIILSEIKNVTNFDGQKTRGYIVGCFLTPELMHNNRKIVIKKVYETAKIAKLLGSKLVVIGGVISVDKENEEKINALYGLSLANGSATSTMIMDKRIATIIKKNNLKYNDVSLSIINAASVKGRLISEFFSKYDFKKILLIDNNKERLTELKSRIKKDIYISTDLNELVHSDLIIIAPSYNRLKFDSRYFKNDVMVYDINDPHYNFQEIMKKVKMSIYSNGLININNIDYNYNLGIPKFTAHSCLTESFLLAMARDTIFKYYNNVTLHEVDQVREYFNKSNFSLHE